MAYATPARGRWAGLVLLTGFSGAAEAQVAAEPDDAIVVTAQGRPQDKRDVPLTITSYDQAQLHTLGVNDLRDLSAFVPGLTVETQYPTTPYIVIRGISTNTPDPTSEPRISVFVDGVYASRPQAALTELFDVRRIEVIKGPQSTLFGRSALTGAISIIENKADPSALAASVRGTIGNLGERRVESMINVPLTSNVALRVSGVYRNIDGYVGNLAGGSDFNGNRLAAGRAVLSAESGSGARIDLIANVQHDRFGGLSYKSGLYYPTDPATGARTGDLSPYDPAYLSTAPGYPIAGMGGRRDAQSAAMLFETPLADRLSLSGTLAWTHFRARFAGDFDGTPLSIITSGEDGRNRQFSGDARLTWTPTDRIRLVLGGNGSDERASQYFPIAINEREVLALETGVLSRTNPVLQSEGFYNNPAVVAGQLGGLLGAYGIALPQAQLAAIAANVPTDHREDLTRRSDARYYDIFADSTFDVTDKLQLQGGLRWSRVNRTSGLSAVVYDRSILGGVFGALQQPAAVRTALLGALAAPGAGTIPTSTAYPLPVFGLLSQPTATAAGDSASLGDDGLTGRASIRYAATPSLNLFASYARGRRPAVLTAQPPTTPGGFARFTPLSAETVDTMEAGAKLRTPDRKLELDATGYYYFYNHFQTQVVQGTTLVSLDAGKAHSYGLETSATYRPIPALSLFATYGYSHARFADGLYDGNHVRLSPDHQASAGMTLAKPFAHGTASFTPTVDWRSRLYFDDSNGNLALLAGGFLPPIPYQASQAGYARGNLRLAYERDGGAWRVELFVANVTDKRYLRDLGQGSLEFGLPSYVAAPPRTFGATLTLKANRG